MDEEVVGSGADVDVDDERRVLANKRDRIRLGGRP